MPNVITEVTTEVLQAFADAWNRHDVDALMEVIGVSRRWSDRCGHEGDQSLGNRGK